MNFVCNNFVFSSRLHITGVKVIYKVNWQQKKDQWINISCHNIGTTTVGACKSFENPKTFVDMVSEDSI